MSRRTYKVLVQNSANCVDTALYIKDNIRAINRAGVKIRLEKLTEEDLGSDIVDSLRRRGITRLPAMTGGKMVIVGSSNIISTLKQIVRSADENPIDVGGVQMRPVGATGSTVDDFWMKEMFVGRNEKGLLVAKSTKDDDDGIGDAKDDIERRLREYETGKKPAHRISTDEPDLQRPQQPQPQQQPRPGQYHQEDNISRACMRCESDPCLCGTGSHNTQQGGDDDVSSMMAAAWGDY